MPASTFNLWSFIIVYLATLFAAMVLYIVTLGSGIQKKFEAFLKGFFPDHSDLFYFRWCFICVVMVGSLIGVVLFNPQTIQQAFGAGLGWVGVLNGVIKSGKN